MVLYNISAGFFTLWSGIVTALKTCFVNNPLLRIDKYPQLVNVIKRNRKAGRVLLINVSLCYKKDCHILHIDETRELGKELRIGNRYNCEFVKKSAGCGRNRNSINF
jgi:hypothetical protein